MSASADGGNGLNCVSLAGLDVEKLRGEGMSLLTCLMTSLLSIGRMGQGSRKF